MTNLHISNRSKKIPLEQKQFHIDRIYSTRYLIINCNLSWFMNAVSFLFSLLRLRGFPHFLQVAVVSCLLPFVVSHASCQHLCNWKFLILYLIHCKYFCANISLWNLLSMKLQALVIARLQAQYGQYFSSLSYFAGPGHWKNVKIWETGKTLVTLSEINVR